MSGQHLDSGIHLPARHFNGPYAISDSGSEIDHCETGADSYPETRAELLPEEATFYGSDISPELSEISVNIQRVLQLRHKFIKLSLQGPDDNPKDRDDWEIYPPPPNPTWDENKSRPSTDTTGPKYESTQHKSTSPTEWRRKMGHDIGEDFDMRVLEPLPGDSDDINFEIDGSSIYQIYGTARSEGRTPLVDVPTLNEFYRAMDEIQRVSSDGPTKSFAYRQLDILEGKFQLYFLVHSYEETADCKKVPHRDFYNVRKVDTHVHHSACMNQKHLLRFIKSKMKKCPGEKVMFRDGKELTLQEVFDSIHLSAYDLSIDTLDMHVRLALTSNGARCFS